MLLCKVQNKVIINKYKLRSLKVNQCRKTNTPSNHLMIKGVQILMIGLNLTRFLQDSYESMSCHRTLSSIFSLHVTLSSSYWT